MVGIYKITNLYTGDCYVGQSRDIAKRWKEHFCKGYGAQHKKNFQQMIDIYGKDGFSFTVLEECKQEQLIEREKYWIGILNPIYNTVFDGHPVSQETREKISAKLTGIKQSEETKAKRKASIRERHKRIPQTNEGHRKKVGVEGLGVFRSVKDAATYIGVNPSTITKALRRGGNVKQKKVWYVV